MTTSARPHPAVPATARTRRPAGGLPAAALAVALVATAAGCGGEAPTPPPSPPSTPTTTAASAPSPTPRDAQRNPGPLRVSGRTLVDKGGATFTWVGDTAWNLASLSREDVDRYLDKRAEQGFTVIQFAPVFLEPGKLANAYGDEPFDGDVSRLRTTPGAEAGNAEQYDYWDHIDYIVRGIHARGMTAAMVAIWSFNHAGKTITAANAGGYGDFLGTRYGGAGVVYAMGGDDRNPHPDIWPPLADAIRKGATRPVPADADGGTRATSDRPLITYHPVGQQVPTYGYRDVDFFMAQAGHCVRDGYQNVLLETYRAVGDKPYLDDEPLYEAHPICWKPQEFGYSSPEQVRRQMYWGVFAGGFGVVYGHHSVWQFYVPGKTAGLAWPKQGWQEALDAPAAQQVRHMAAFLRLRPGDGRVPANEVIRGDAGGGYARKAAMRDASGRWLMAYLPEGGRIELDPTKLPGDQVTVSWFDPRTGQVREAGRKSRGEAASLAAPSGGAGSKDDWILVLDRA